MAVSIGYLLPTREAVMEGRFEARPLLDLAQEAESLGYDSIWVGDSLLARPRHEPLILLSAVAGLTRRVALGTAVLLPALRNPVVLAHQIATLDRIAEGRIILGVGIAGDASSIRAEFLAAGVPFEGRVGRMLEGLRLARALWSGNPVDWQGRWQLKDAVLGPTPARPGGPPIWIGGMVEAALDRVGKRFEGWFPNGPDAASFAAGWTRIESVARAAGRDPKAIAGAVYLTLAIDEDASAAQRRLDAYFESYYGQIARFARRRQAAYAGPPEGAIAWLKGFIAAGASHLVLRFSGDHDRQLELFAKLRGALG
jgi:alkanesulfonate monooxygenase SsuD/methylene tetrahydromethanopterin reductase-like flavin-dependent oxidoreductase (luciferase family)